MSFEEIKEDDYVLLVHKNKRWLIRVKKDQRFQTHVSSLNLSDLIGLKFGSKTPDGKYYVFKPLLIDHVMKFKRPTQIIYPKDAAYILLKLNVSPGSKVLELGTGSGAMTAYLANAVKPNGKVYSFDVNEEYLNVAKRNLEVAGLLDYVNLSLFKANLPKEEFDLAFVDIGDPWVWIDQIWISLKPSSPIGFLLPTYNQLEKLYASFKGKFYPEETVEIIVRRLQVAENKTRPQNFVTGHTAFLTFARKVLSE